MNGADSVPEWILWLAGAVGSMVGAFVIRMGWKSGGGEKTSEKQFTIDAALVDSKAVERHTAAIEAQTLEMVRAHQDADKMRAVGHRVADAMEDAVAEMREVRNEVRKLGENLLRR